MRNGTFRPAFLASIIALAAASPASGAGLDLSDPPQAPNLPGVELPPPVSDTVDEVRGTVGGLVDRVEPVLPPDEPEPAPPPPTEPPDTTFADATPTTPPPAEPVTRGEGGPAGGARPARSPAADASSRDRRGGGGDPADARGASGSGRATEETEAPGLPAQLVEALSALPTSLLLAMLGIALLGVAMAARSAWLAIQTSRLRRQERLLTGDVGILQDALLPPIPRRIGSVGLSVAYRAADGPAAGGDFHDVFQLDDGSIGVIVGDVSGHGREALASTTLVHYTLRAHLEAGVRPREVLRLADRSLTGKLGVRYATVVVGVYDPETSSLEYATAGHPAPLIRGEAADHAVHALAPPIGLGPEAGRRETRVSVPNDSAICFFTDGLIEARADDGRMIERAGLASILERLVDRVDAPAVLSGLPSAASGSDDVTACVLEPLTANGDGTVIEELEVDAASPQPRIKELMVACGMSAEQANAAAKELQRRGLREQRSVLRIERFRDRVAWTVGGTAAASGTSTRRRPERSLRPRPAAAY